MDEEIWSDVYGRLCRKMMEQISPKVQDDEIMDSKGEPVAGGQLFRKYLLNRCQEGFERGRVVKEAAAAAGVLKLTEDKTIDESLNNKSKEDGKEETMLYSNEYYAAQKTKGLGLGLIKCIGELFKQQMLTERIMHECVQKLLGNIDNPKEEEIESLCKLLTAVGGILDTPKARAHLDLYFLRMKELTKSPNVSSRMRYMLIDLIELRDRKWASRTAVAAPMTIAQIHEKAVKEKMSSVLSPSHCYAHASMRGRKELHIANDLEEFFFPRNLDESEACFAKLPLSHHPILVDTFIRRTVESNEEDARHVAEFFTRISGEKLCSAHTFVAGFMPTAKMIDDIVLDSPKAFALFSTMAKGANLNGAERMTLASHSMNSRKFLELTRPVYQVKAHSDAQLVSEFLKCLVRAGTCSTALLHEKTDAIVDIVQDFQDFAPDALEKLSLMIKGAEPELDGK